MEVVGGFMVMMAILCFFLTVIWLVMPFVVFAVKGKVERTLVLLESIDRRLALLEARVAASETELPELVSSEAPEGEPQVTPPQPS